ncbi:glycosyltransferase family 1 protein [Microbacterium flavescens]|uniref:glycosyltransferase family 1 protein n=1 Tax=Microbacterium flavescens TaxID=69366 RepID=UPI001BDDE252|nr:glycosyltransferase family 1 protein [Microbacterium flavescens]
MESEAPADTLIDVLYTDLGRGWVPITRLASLTARVLGARLVTFRSRRYERQLALFAARQRLPPRRGGERIALVIAARPEHLTAVLRLGPLTSRYASVVGWVIDSFWHERIPYVSRTGRFDRIYVTDEDDVGDWRSACATTPIHVLPWGADTAQAVPVRKTVDIQRLGRMPPAWDDDAEGSGWARAQHLDYRGRPSFGQDDAEAQRNVDDALAVARFVLAFSNLTSGASYTHPTRDYLTARWTDGLAHGAVVAGAAPASTTARELLWPGATLELPPDDLRGGMALLAEANSGWTPETAEANRRRARDLLDWRLRIAVIARDLGITSAILEEELRAIAKA